MSFAAGALFGCGAILLPLSLLGTASPAAAGPQLRHRAPMRVEAPVTALKMEAPASPSLAAAAPAAVDRPAPKVRSASNGVATKDHWELELTLD
jgi:hypothetical protein